MKKILKILAGLLIVLLSVLLIVPYFFEDDIERILKESINENINAKVDFNDLDISLISNFPSVKISLHRLVITSFEPFKGDTLASAKTISLKLPLTSLFKASSGKINVSSFSIDESQINIQIDEKGNANYAIAKENTPNSNLDANHTDDAISFNLDSYRISNSTIRYLDVSSGMGLDLTDFNHSGNGDFSNTVSNLKTETQTQISVVYEDTKYLDDNTIKLKAIIGVDLNENEFTFLENEALINQLPLVFNGLLKINEHTQELDIQFNTPSSDFKNFLALIPEKYLKDFDDVTTSGKFSVEGFAKGIIDKNRIPQFSIQFTSDNASIKYPDLPKSIDNIYLNTAITNTTGIANDSKINIEHLSFKIDEDVFSANAYISDPIKNPKIKASAKGTVNLNSIGKVYPLDEIKDLQGLLTADFETVFDMKSIEQKNYKNTQNSGHFSIVDFKYEGAEMAKPIEIEAAQMTFTTHSAQLNNFDARTGNSDLKMYGTINNLVGFILNDENIEGTFNLNSNTFDVSDFMTTTKDDMPREFDSDDTEQLKIPSFLECTIHASATTVIYDHLHLKNVKGTLIIANEAATIHHLTSDIFDGELVLDGAVSTKADAPTFSMQMEIDAFDIAQSFSELELFHALAPIADVLEGKINTSINISGFLNEDLSPDFSTISGDAQSEILTSKTTLQNSEVLSLVDSNLNFIDLDKIDLKTIKAFLSFEEGKVNIKPFHINYEDIAIEISGKHGFDQTMDYKLTLDVPATYFGNDVSSLMANLSDQEKENIKVPLNAHILGSFSKPTFSADMNGSVENLTSQLVDYQKDKLINQGQDELNKLLNINTEVTDSTKTDGSLENTANSILNSLFKKKKDTID